MPDTEESRTKNPFPWVKRKIELVYPGRGRQVEWPIVRMSSFRKCCLVVGVSSLPLRTWNANVPEARARLECSL